MDEELKNKLNEMFDLSGAEITKKQSCKKGRWLFTLAMTLLFCGLYAVLVWGALVFYGQALFIFLVALLTLVLMFALFRIWLGFTVDIVSAKFAEQITFIRDGDKRYYYSRGNYTEKFEYEYGNIAVCGKSYDKYEDKSQYSRLAGRYSRSLQRRSSLFATLSPAFWFDMIREWDYSVSSRGIEASTRGGKVSLECGSDGKISRIDYLGDGYLLYDSASPIKMMDCKLPGKYAVSYEFAPSKGEKIKLRNLFYVAFADFLMPLPPEEHVVHMEPAEEE